MHFRIRLCPKNIAPFILIDAMLPLKNLVDPFISFTPKPTQMQILQRLFVLLSLIISGTATSLYAQTTWTGSFSTAWNSSTNWTAGIPTASSDVTIPNTTNKPQIPATAVAKSVTVNAGAVLTINAGATLTLNGAASESLNNSGTIENNGTITIGNTGSAGQYGILNFAVLNNNSGGVINIDRATGTGSVALYNSQRACNFTNSGIVNIGQNSASGFHGIMNHGLITNLATGRIFIDRVTTAAIETFWVVSGPLVYNFGEITIGALNGGNTMVNGIIVSRNIYNRAGAVINIDRVGTAFLYSGSDITNEGVITVGKTTEVPQLLKLMPGQIVAGDLLNRANALFEGSGTQGIIYKHDGGTISPGAGAGVAGWMHFNTSAHEYFTNGIVRIDVNGAGTAGISYDQIRIDGEVSLGSTISFSIAYTPVTGDRITVIRAAKVNGAFGTVTGLPAGWNLTYTDTTVVASFGVLPKTSWTGTVDADWDKAGNWSNGVPTARSEVTIPDVVTDPVIGSGNAVALSVNVQAGALLTINPSRTLTINNSFEHGLVNRGTINNNGDITLGSTGDINLMAIVNHGAFNNNLNARIFVNRAAAFTYAIANLGGVFTNSGVISINASAGISNHGLYNQGDFTNTKDGSVKVDRVSGNAIYNVSYNNFYNYGAVEIGAIASAGTNGIYNETGYFWNWENSSVKVDRVSSAAINDYGVFFSQGNVTIGSSPGGNTMNYGFVSDDQFNHRHGVMRIDRVNTALYINRMKLSSNTSSIIVGELTDVPVMMHAAIASGTFTNQNGLFKGRGSVNGTRFVNSAGTIEPGAPIGKMMFTGKLTLDAGALVAIDINGAGTAGVDYDQIETDGTATLAGRLNISINYTPRSGDKITIIKAGNLVGAFAQVSAIPIGWKYYVENNALILEYVPDGQTTWTGAVNSNWHGSLNWSNGVPTGNTIAIIPDVTNDPVISTTNAVAAHISILAGATLTVNSSGILRLNNALATGIANAGTLINYGQTFIGAASAGETGINNAGIVNVVAGSGITINRTRVAAIRNSAGTFTVNGTISIGKDAASGNDGIVNDARIIIGDAGVISFDRLANVAIWNRNGNFEHAGVISIGSLAAGNTFVSGIYNEARFFNTGTVYIDRVATGFVSFNNVTNMGRVIIGSSSSVPALIRGGSPGSFSNYFGELRGSGTIQAAHYTGYKSKLSPGYAIGKISFDNSKDLSTDTINIEVNGAGVAGVDYDQLTVSGTVTIGAALALSVNYSPSRGDELTLISATTVSGRFATVTGLPAGMVLEYTSNAVKLVYPGEKIWTGAVNSDWTNAGNWQPNQVPGNAEGVVLPSSGVARELVVNSAVTVGSMDVGAGRTVMINSSGSISVSGQLVNNGVIKGTGTLINTNFVNAGTIAPGSSPGILALTGNLTNQGRIEVEITGNTPGTQYDQLTVSGTATLGGNLVISKADGINISVGHTYTVLTASAITGTFSSITWPVGVSGVVNYTATAVTINVNSVLPLTLISFTGDAMGNNISLKWKTAQEENTSEFDIERSIDGISFGLAGKVAAAGSGANNYSFDDKQSFNGVNYYRLKMKDRDGSFTYSRVIQVTVVDKLKGVVITPVPATTKISISIKDPSLVGRYAQVFNPSGILMKSILATSVIDLDISDWAKGIYFVMIKGEVYRFMKL
jgi:hypothetical protein